MTVRAINQYTILREKKTGRIGSIIAMRLDLEPRNVTVLVKFRGHSNPVGFSGLHNILDSLEPVGHLKSTDDDCVACGQHLPERRQ